MSRETPAIRRTDEASVFAVSSLLRPDRPGAAPSTATGWGTAGDPAELLRGLAEPGADRWGIARRAACSASAEEIAWRRAWHAVESCRRVAELAARR
jgi:hypothetical protein